MLHLRLLGGAVVEEDGTPVGGAAAHRHSLALLAVLAAAAPAGVTRGRLVGLLWPESPEKVARNRLNTCLHRLRRALDPDVVTSIGDHLALATDRLPCDLLDLRNALSHGDPAQAVSLYRGPFLDGFWIRGSSAFDHWMDRERDQVQTLYREALESLAHDAVVQGNREEAVRWWARRSQDEPANSHLVMAWMEALRAADNVPGALEVGQGHIRFLENELGIGPGRELRSLLEELKSPVHEGGTDPGAQSTSRPPDLYRIAILPFVELGGEPGASAFASGLHHDLLTRLSRIRAFTVICRTSVLPYVGGAASVAEIAQELDVGTIVEGGVQQVGDRIRLNVQLIEVSGDRHLWAETYDREFSEAATFELQSELADRIASTLQAELTGGERRAVAGRPAADLDTYLLYVQGRTHMSRRSMEELRRAEEYFRRAIAADGNYAPAWAGLGQTLGLSRWYGHPEQVSDQDPLEPTRMALELDPELSEAHTALGLIHVTQCEGPGALGAFARAVELNPSDPDAQNWLGWVQMILGRPDLGVGPAQRSVGLSPMAPYTRAFLAHIYLAGGRYEAARREAARARELDPGYWVAYLMEGWSLHHLSRFAESRFLLSEAEVRLADWQERRLRDQIQVSLALSRMAEGRGSSRRHYAIPEVERGAALEDALEDPVAVGLLQAAQGRLDEAFAAFQRVPRWGISTPLIRYLFPRLLASFRDDARFGGLLTEIDRSWGLPVETRAGAPEEKERAGFPDRSSRSATPAERPREPR